MSSTPARDFGQRRFVILLPSALARAGLCLGLWWIRVLGMKSAEFAFSAGLIDLLPRHRRRSPITIRFSGPQTTKHLIESLGIPHTELGDVIVDGAVSSLHHIVQSGEVIEVLEVCSPPWGAEEPRFVLDGHLGRLNAGLRMLGLDCAYQGNCPDDELVERALVEDRILLSRDRRLLMRKSVVNAHLVRSLDPQLQLESVIRRFGLGRWFRPFRRCIRCNQQLARADKQSLTDRLLPLTRLYFDDFRICPSCGQLYWKGSHFKRLESLVAHLRSLS